jgi:hypothetical protein
MIIGRRRCCLLLFCLGCLINLNHNPFVVVVNAEEPDMDEVLPIAPVADEVLGTVEPTPIVCESFHYDCYNCISKGCYWCTFDSLCFPTPEFVSKQSPNYDILFPNKIFSCRTEEDFTQETCTAPNNFFTDPMYGGQNWIFEMINVKPVWYVYLYLFLNFCF